MIKIYTQVLGEIKEAMKAKNKELRDVLRGIVSAAKMIAKNDNNRQVSDMDVIKAIKHTMKQNKDAIVIAEKNNRSAMKQVRENAILETYLPKQATEKEVEEFVASFLKKNKNCKMGDVMKAIRNRYGINIDMRMASRVVQRSKP